ncbi:A24 family peptidase [Nocardia sp. NBC_01327]|uniref:A24 family peptidase n=1 Tax=Nocardia sp. NBC_01327 TaxID=2903593 RepID=UPI002E1469C5|nr:A24 family peptidase [Nocardia sp. NBC_01327]
MRLLPLLVLAAWCAALSCVDLRMRRLPNSLTLPGAVAVLCYGSAIGRPAAAVLGALLLAVPYLLVHLCAPAALGAGDVKLALGLGAATALGGAHAWVWAALAAPAITALAGVGTLLTQAVEPGDSAGPDPPIGTLAHGPAMCAASVLALLATP